MTVSRAVWQTYLVDNRIDSTSCSVKAGSISVQTTMTDSVVDGNKLSGARNIQLHSLYNTVPSDAPIFQEFDYFIDVQRNTISSCYDNGVVVSFGARVSASDPGGVPSPVTNGYGIRLGYNAVTGADQSGGILFANGWTSPINSKLDQSPLIYKNNISEGSGCDPRGIGITIPSYVWGASLYGNTFQNVPTQVDNHGS
jgi:hypothetical protein